MKEKEKEKAIRDKKEDEILKEKASAMKVGIFRNNKFIIFFYLSIKYF